MDLKTLEQKFKEKNNFKKIFYHNNASKKEFQRLEFVGDRVLALILATEVYNKFNKFNEGKLANIFSYLTSSIILAKIAKNIKLDHYIKKKKFNNISNKVLSDFIEALLGSLYIDSGIKNVKNVILDLWKEEIIENKNLKRDAKSILQEWTQAKGLGLPVYKVIEKKGLDHNPTFQVELKVEKHKKITSEGKSLQNAQKKTAEHFINNYIEEKIIVK
ncbi:MAG: hypothetical protein CMJ06_06115 [Pelagibacterales bacterium]|nr:hypothetical protein [Pelagibacterales bacterium]OUU61208.1 MAG: hypothetical protein CBC22_08260 [Alphaproteobacteria bacterium TMED62]